MATLNFTVDSALLKELGERLVGRPHIALAELVKNSYDADAREVRIRFDAKTDAIIITDTGTGMNFEQFRDFWMRIGSPHKQREAKSKIFHRPLTGSKGVGRLSVQFLARSMKLKTIPSGTEDGLAASVDWDTAIKAGDLTQAQVKYDAVARTGQSVGTEIRLEGLRHPWSAGDFENLAKEIWWLQPPFRRPSPAAAAEGFEIIFESSDKEFEQTFTRQIRAIMDIWHARIVGRNLNGHVNLSLEFSGEQPTPAEFVIPDCKLAGGDFEIRIYHLEKRQPHGIKVREARQYFKDNGGVHVYDAGFRLPYYGTAESDWLRVELDHSHRLTESKLLPADLQVSRGLNFLPSLERVFGVVNVNTAQEKNLAIQITRDRLAQGKAYDQLVHMLRWAIDFYAMEEARRATKSRDLVSDIEPATSKAERLEAIIEEFREQIPAKTYKALRQSVREVVVATEKGSQVSEARMSLLGPLATAGISTLAYQHELQKQLSAIDGIIDDLPSIEAKSPEARLAIADLKGRLSGWVKRARDTQALFSYLTVDENRTKRVRLKAANVLDDVKTQTSTLARGVEIEIDKVSSDLILPKASFAEWTAIFQNVIINAFNAVLDARTKRIRCTSKVSGRNREIVVEDTGVGVDLNRADRLFEPFVRESKISQGRQALGYGGTGLGLTIVKLVAENLGCSASFVKPAKGFSTAFRLYWRESE